MDTRNDETEKPAPTEAPVLKPEMVTIGKVSQITHGGGRIWNDGQKNQERQ